MKTILCYGDSNTWGNVPRSDDRYPKAVRWPGALQALLGDGYEVVSEGLCGRTFVAVDPEKPHRTGITHLQAILESAAPIDLAIVMLGTNDMKATYGLSAEEIAAHLEQTIEFIQSGEADLKDIPKIMVVCPPAVVHALDISKQLPGLFRAVAERHGCDFMDAQEHTSSSAIDGYHLDADGHAKLARTLAERIAGI